VRLGCALTHHSCPTVWVAILIFGRDAALGTAAIYYRYASLPAPKTFMRYWDFSLPSAEVHPTNLSKYNTFLQLVLLGAVTALPLAPSTIAGIGVNDAVTGMEYVVAATTIWSGATYTWRKDVVNILGTDEELKKRQGFRGRAIIAVVFVAFLGWAGRDWWVRNRLVEEWPPSKHV
jgi:cardiolipin synthase (CMP-forming)